jgi:DNA-dependent metalloprotease WSS1
MAPKRKSTIVTLDDIHHRTSSLHDPSQSPSASIQNPNSVTSKRRSRNIVPSIYSGNDSGFCQPAANNINVTSISCHAIPAMPQSDVCDATLLRIHQEFSPIIQRRGYNVKSISELCCCADGLDFSSRKGRKCRRMGDNVLGYNQTVISGRSNKTHTIHLRLRHPRQHDRLFAWEDVAGTMAHELAHCMHGPHNDAFFKLMGEILEEHYQLQLHGPNGPSWLKPTNAQVVQRPGQGSTAPNAAIIPQSGGQQLGGNTSSGKSRLIDQFGNGRKLGGSGRTRPLSPREVRELAAQAAEARQRQLQQVRRMMDRAKEPCVIEILDDDEDDDNVSENGHAKEKQIHSGVAADCKPPAKRSKPSSKKESGADFEVKKGSKGVRNTGGHVSVPPNPILASTKGVPPIVEQNDVIDLTNISSDSPTSHDDLECNRCTFKNNSNALSCAMCSGMLRKGLLAGIDCNRCTFRNSLQAASCSMCGSYFG